MNSSEAYQELLEEILNNIEESIEEKDWDAIDSVAQQIREAIDNPFDAYNTEEGQIYGAVIGNRQVLFENRVQQRLSMSRNKRLTNLIDEVNSLEGLVIDWHLANAEMGFDNFVAPIQDEQSTYAYAA